MKDTLKILLVEDNEDDIELTLHALKKSHVRNNVVVLRDGEQALKYLFGSSKHSNRTTDNAQTAMLLDLNLPKVNGIDVLRTIRKQETTKSIPIIILTASSAEEDLINSYHLGVCSYLRKPISLLDFNKAVNNLSLYWLLSNEKPVLN